MADAPLSGRSIGVLVGGSIAAYKACELVRELQRAGAKVRVAMTEAATRFVTPLTFEALTGAPVLLDAAGHEGESRYGHLALSRWAHALVVAPATADLIARAWAGLADDAVTTTLLAFGGPVLIAPAMNPAMWAAETTQRNITELRRRAQFVGPAEGLLADGDYGFGRLAEVLDIVRATGELFAKGALFGKTVLVTAGPTREPIDPVRYLSNPSTGKMGIAVASAAAELGAKVTLVLGPTTERTPSSAELVRVTTAAEMAAEVLSRCEDADYIIAAAAVSDFRPAQSFNHKVKKDSAAGNIVLERTQDILAAVAERTKQCSTKPVLVGFAAETDDVEKNAREKLVAKELNYIFANRIGELDSGFAGDDNTLILLAADGRREQRRGSKVELGRWLWDVVRRGV